MESSKFKFKHPLRVRQTQADRSSLWFNRFAWAITWYQTEISVLRDGLDICKIQKSLANRRNWEKRRFESYYNNYTKGLTPSFVSRFTEECEKNIFSVAKHFRAATQTYKLVLNPDCITVYTNDTDFIQSTVDLVCKSVPRGNVLLRNANISCPPDTVVLKRPYDYQYRTWFKSRKLVPNTIDMLSQWINGLSTEVYACPSLQKFLQHEQPLGWRQSSTWTQDHFFLDHNDPKLDTWISLIVPGIVRKTMTIQSPAK